MQGSQKWLPILFCQVAVLVAVRIPGAREIVFVMSL
jgi:hypothetical protein